MCWKSAWRRWKAAHTNLLCCWTHIEWDNTVPLTYARAPKIADAARRKEVLDFLGAEPRDRYERVRVQRRFYDRMKDLYYGDDDVTGVMFASLYSGHVAAGFGAKMLIVETTNTTGKDGPEYRWNVSPMFCRGAARQFALPWYWYIASYFMGYERDGRPNPNCYRTASRHGGNHGPDFGLSLSAIERTMWKAWLSGAGSYEREAMTDSIFDKDAKPWRLSDEGLVYERYYNVVTTHGRGVPYTPIALLVPMCRGESRALGRPFTYNLKCPYAHADHMTDAILATALDFPKNMTEKAMKAGVERVMANSRFGDLFDALTPDFPDQTSFRRILPAYPCAVLCGEYGINRELSGILREYVERGGTLVLSVAQLDTFPVDLSSCKPLENPAFCDLRMGKGRVIVGKTPYLTDWEGANEAEAARKALAAVTRGNPQRFPDIEWLVESLVRRFSPISVKGDVQWGLNRTKDGWLVYLINNAGVIKFASSAPEFLPGGSEIEVDLGRLGVTTANDILTGTPGTLANGILRTVVPHGGVAIFEIR